MAAKKKRKKGAKKGGRAKRSPPIPKRKKGAKKGAKKSAKKGGKANKSPPAPKRKKGGKARTVAPAPKRKKGAKKGPKKGARQGVKSKVLKRKKGAKKAGKKKALKRKRPVVGVQRVRPDVRPPRAEEREPRPIQRPERRRIEVTVRRVADVLGFDEGQGFSQERATKSSGFNSLQRGDYEQTLKNWFTNFAVRAGAGDPSEIPIFRYGILARSEDILQRADVIGQMAELKAFLEKEVPKGWAVHMVDEGTNYSVRLGLGSYESPRTLDAAVRDMEYQRPKLRAIMRRIDEIMEDGDWVAFADIPDEWDVGS